MSRTGATLLFFALGTMIYSVMPLAVQTQTSPQPPRQSAPLPPSSRDMPLPDPATFPKPDDKTKSPAQRPCRQAQSSVCGRRLPHLLTLGS